MCYYVYIYIHIHVRMYIYIYIYIYICFARQENDAPKRANLSTLKKTAPTIF